MSSDWLLPPQAVAGIAGRQELLGPASEQELAHARDHFVSEGMPVEIVEALEAVDVAHDHRDLALVAARTAPAWPRRQPLLVPTPAPVPVEELELPALAKRCAFQATEEGLKVVCVVPKVASSAEPG